MFKKSYKLSIILFTILQITNLTLYANEKPIYIKEEELKKWEQHPNFQNLKKPLEELCENGIAHPVNNQQPILPRTYFVVGLTGAGKSTFIFTLQGNNVIETPKESGGWGSDSEGDYNNNTTQNKTPVNNLNNYYGKIGPLTLTKTTIDLPTPEVADGSNIVTKRPKIYYTGKNIKNPMAFCDTKGFFYTEEEDNSNPQEIVDTYAPYFVLTKNKIGGIVFLVSEGNLNYRDFIKNAAYVQNFLPKITEANQEQLKKSILLVITKGQKDKEEETFEKLARLIKSFYKNYYKNESFLHRQSSLIKPFLSLFLKKDVAKDKMKKAKFHKLIDRSNVHFFYPYNPQNVKETRKKLRNLSPITYKEAQFEHIINKVRPTSLKKTTSQNNNESPTSNAPDTKTNTDSTEQTTQLKQLGFGLIGIIGIGIPSIYFMRKKSSSKLKITKTLSSK